MMANGFAACSNHPGRTDRVNKTIELITTRVMASHRRSESAVVRTNILPSPERVLTIMVRTSSPARAGKKLLPKYPAAVAQNAVATSTGACAWRRTRQRMARRNNATVTNPAAAATKPKFARNRVVHTPLQSIPRSE